MRQALTIHPQSICAAVASIEADVVRAGDGRLVLNYAVTGVLRDLYLPQSGAPARADELWRRTCFEAFIRATPGEAYVEVNVSPSRQWAAYGFSGYRAGMRTASEIDEPSIKARTADGRFELEVCLELGPLPELPSGAPWRLGLAAVIEEASGRKSYWALGHPPGRPDFHSALGFAYDLPMAKPR